MRQPLRRVGLHPSVQLALSIANAEACQTGSRVVEPVHLLVAVLRIVDDNYDQAAEALKLPPAAVRAVAEVAADCRAMLSMSDEEITAARRGLRQALGGREPLPHSVRPRSGESNYLFQRAALRMVRAGEDQLSIAHLLDALLDQLPGEAAPYIKAERGADPSLPPLPRPRYSVGVFDSGGAPAAPRQPPQPARPPRASATPGIDEIGRDLTALARKGQLMPIVGREAEMTAVARYLQRTSKRNVIITGEAGVGKTAVVEGLAQRLIAEGTPEFLRRLRIVQVSVADLVSGTKYRGDMEQRVKGLIDEAVADPDVVLFFDEIHLMMKGGAGGESPMDIANLLKPALAREDFRCIGATTTEEFERYVSGDAAFMRRFQVLRLGEPSAEEALRICHEWARRIESIQQVVIEGGAVEAAVSLSARLIRGRSLPDKAIDLLENATTYVKVSTLSFDEPPAGGELPRVTREHIENVLEEQYGLPASAAEALDAESVGAALRAGLVGQDGVAAALVESLAALGRRREDSPRPLGVFMFTGPTGVGKTYAAECVSRALFGEGGAALGRFNMSEYKERHELARLIGAPPGFVGHEHQGALFRFARTSPRGLILLDEMEKAHPEIQDYFLQIFDQGQALDARGTPADFRHHLFVMTCNIVPAEKAGGGIGFRPAGEGSGREDALDEQLEKHFRPEFLARIDRVVAFRPLSAGDYEQLFERHLAALRDEAARQHAARLELTDDARRLLFDACADQDEGARGFARLFERLLAAPLLNYLDRNPAQGAVRVGASAGRLSFSTDGAG